MVALIEAQVALPPRIPIVPDNTCPPPSPSSGGLSPRPATSPPPRLRPWTIAKASCEMYQEQRHLAEDLPDDLQVLAIVGPRQHQHLHFRVAA